MLAHYRNRLPTDGGGSKTLGLGLQHHLSCLARAAHQYTVDTTLHGEVSCQYAVVLSLCYASTPLGSPIQREVYGAVVERTATPLAVEHLHLYQGEVNSISMESLGVRGQRQA